MTIMLKCSASARDPWSLKLTDHIAPTPAQFEAVMAAATTNGGPVVMLNLNKYREVARYENAGSADEALSGRAAYARYGEVAGPAVASVGGRVIWTAPAQQMVIGCEHDEYDHVIAVWYPDRAAFGRLGAYPGYLEATIHRAAALERAMILACEPPGALAEWPGGRLADFR